MDILLLILAVLFITALKPAPGRGFFRKPLAAEQTTCIQGLLGILVLLCHIAQKTKTGYIFGVLAHGEFLWAALFFMLSAYGMTRQYKEKGPAYLKGFLQRKFGKVLIPYIFMNVIYYFGYRFMKLEYTWRQILKMYLQGDTFVLTSWFVFVLLICYLGFYLCMKLFKKHMGTGLLVLSIYFMAYMLLCQWGSFDIIWYCSLPGFLLGIAWAFWEEEQTVYLHKYYWLYLLLAVLFFALSTTGLVLAYRAGARVNILYVILHWLAATGAGGILLVLCQKIRFQNLFWGLTGGITYELYMIQGLILLLFRNDQYYVEMDFLFAVTVIGISVLVAIVLHYFFKGVLFVWEKFLLRD